MFIPGRGGKEDDITVTVAQIFYNRPGTPKARTAENDPYFKESKYIYEGAIPTNRFDMFTRARFNT